MTSHLTNRWSVRATVLALVALLAALPLLGSTSAFAHPLGNFTTNRYARIEIYQDRAHIHYVVDMAEIPTFQVMPLIDTDGDGAASPAELEAFASASAARYPESFAFTANGAPASVTLLETRAQLLPGQGGLQVLRHVAVYESALPTSGVLALAFTDSNFERSQGWKEIVVRPSGGAEVNVDARLTVDQSNALLEYPAESLTSAPDVRSVAFSWMAGTGSVAPAFASIQSAEPLSRSSGFAGIFENLADGNVTLGFLALSLLIAFAFGAQHALGPGHGKAMVAAYLVGSRGTSRHAVALGFTVTATHTFTVYLLGIVTLVAAAYITPETVYVWMGVVAGAMVVTFGAVLFVQRLLAYRRQKAIANGEHRHGIFGRAHTHAPAEHVHAETPGHSELHGPATESRVTWRSLLSLGVLGGLLPCPSAVVVMVAAISQGQVLLGMLLIVAFSLGLAGVLTLIGVSLVVGRRIPARQRRLLERPIVARAMAVTPVFSALVVFTVGIGLTYQAFARV